MWKFEGEDLRGCLFERITRQSYDYLESYYYFDVKNMFPNPGGWQDQPHKFLQAMNVIEAERRRISREEDKEK